VKDLLTEIRYKLYEELGVADIVSTTSNDILSKIIQHSKTVPSQKNSIRNYKHGNFAYNFENSTININYDLYYVSTYNDIFYSISNNRGSSNKINNNTYELKTTIVYVSDINQYIDFNGNLQHELEHIYQMIKSGKHLLSNRDSLSLYKKSEKLKNSFDFCDKIVGTVVYYGCRFEKDAFANAIYRQIINNPNNNPYETLKSTITYQNINTIKKYVLDSEIYKNKFTDIVKTNFGKNYTWFYNLTNKVVKTYINKIGKVYAKAYNDLNKKYHELDGGTFGIGEELLK